VLHMPRDHGPEPLVDELQPRWARENVDMHVADLAEAMRQEASQHAADLAADRAVETDRPRRKPVIRVNGEIVDPER
jgi:hypothetical protein